MLKSTKVKTPSNFRADFYEESRDFTADALIFFERRRSLRSIGVCGCRGSSQMRLSNQRILDIQHQYGYIAIVAVSNLDE